MAVGEAAAAGEPGGPRGPVDASWLILQRLDDLRRGQDDLRRSVDDLRKSQDDLRRELKADIDSVRAELGETRRGLKAEIDSVRAWSLGLLLLAILGLLAKLLLPAA